MNYLDSLKLLKKSFLGGTETQIISDIVNNHFKGQKRVSWLDVGIGDGDSLRKILRGIELSQTYLVTGIDPLVKKSNTIKDVFPNAKLIAQQFEKYVTQETFDVINVRQSVYYLKEKEQALQKMLVQRADGGLLLITNWSEKDICCKLHNSLFPNSRHNITGEEIVGLITRNNSNERIEVIEFKGEVDVSFWKQSDEMLEAAVTIISREQLRDDQLSKYVTELKNVLQNLNDKEERINLVICVRKGNMSK